MRRGGFNAVQELSKSRNLYQKAVHTLPLGVSSNFRFWGPANTRYIARGKGGHIWDVDGNRYIDYRLGYGPAILGHADERVDRAVFEAMQQGATFAMSTPREQVVAEKIVAMCPGVKMVRFANSGTEATMHALRLARAATGRDKLIMFEGQYHGLHDYVMFSSLVDESGAKGTRRRPVVAPFSSGIPAVVQDMLIMLPFNDLEVLEEVVRASWHEVAAILVEPMLGNCGGIMPDPEWLPAIRRLCDEYGMVMIMDEVKTGFRLARGGAQEYFGVRADLVTYAKAMGNGYPVAAFGGRRELMELLGKGVAHGGTFSGNQVSMAAAEATLDILQNTDALEQIEQRGLELQDALSEVLDRSGIPYVFSGHPSLFIFWFAEQAPREYRDWKNSDNTLYDCVAAGLIKRGVMPEPDSREPWFMCAAHSEQDVAETATALEDVMREVLN